MLRLHLNDTPASSVSRELPPDPATELRLFHSLELERPSKFWSMLGSLGGHIFVVAVVTVLSQHMSWLGYEEIDWSRYRVEPAPIRLRLSQPLIFAANRPAPAPKPRHTTPAERAQASASPAPAAAPAKSGPAVPRRLELPVPRAAAQNAPIIIQPDFLPQATPPPQALPPLAFWARQAPERPKQPRNEVVPGRTEAPSPAPKLAAPPVSAIPNRETMIADINVSMPQLPVPQTPALLLQNSATTPVRLREATESKGASLESAAGEAANIMALGTERRDIRNVEIARGLQNIPNLAAGDSAGTAADHNATTAAPAGRGSASASENASTTTASANSAGASPRPGATGGRGGAATSSAASETASGSPSPNSAASAANPSDHTGTPFTAGATVTRPITPPDVTRIEHPTNGNFDVVVMQSATRDDLPDLGGILTGNPVYSVYLRVGDQKEWLMEYCVPAREVAQNNPYEINLDEAGAITPPFPISTVVPNNLLGQQTGKQIVLHGFLTATGSLQGIKARDNNPVVTQLLTLLNQWQFRPALRNKKPIDVEIVLVIPPRG